MAMSSGRRGLMIRNLATTALSWAVLEQCEGQDARLKAFQLAASSIDYLFLDFFGPSSQSCYILQ